MGPLGHHVQGPVQLLWLKSQHRCPRRRPRRGGRSDGRWRWPAGACGTNCESHQRDLVGSWKTPKSGVGGCAERRLRNISIGGFNSVGPCLSAALFDSSHISHDLTCKSRSTPLPLPKAMPVGARGSPHYPTVGATSPKSRRTRQNENRVILAFSARLDAVVDF